MDHSVVPFPGPVDDWPAERADNVQLVIQIRDQVQAASEREAKSTAEYEQWKAARKK